jgi:AcrR family transcriptional regulator
VASGWQAAEPVEERAVSRNVAKKVMAAAQLFAARGLDSVTMNDIAAATGIPRATLYYHFDSKEDVFAFLFTRAFDDFENAVADALEASGSAADRLAGVLRAQLDFYASHPMAREAVHLNLGRGPQIAEVIERARAAYFWPVAKLLEEGVTDGSFRPISNTTTLAAAILGSMTTAASQALQTGDEQWVDDLHETMVSFVFHGLAP